MRSHSPSSSSDEPRTLHKLWFMIPRSQRIQMPVLIILLVIGAGLEVVGIGLLVPLINLLTSKSVTPEGSVLEPVFDVFNSSTQIQMLTVGFILVGVVVFFKNVYLAVVSYFQNLVLLRVKQSIEIRIFNGYVDADYSFHLRSNSSALSKNLSAEVSRVAFSVVGPVALVAIESLTIIGITALLMYFQPVASLALVTFFALCGITYARLVNPLLVSLGQRRSDLDGKSFKAIAETLGGVKQLKVVGREKFFQDRFAQISRDSFDVSVRAETVQRFPAYLVELWAVLGLLVVVFTLLLQGEDTSSIISSLGLFVGSSFRFVPSLNRILGASQILKMAKFPIDIVYAELTQSSAAAPKRERIHFASTIEFRDIGFTYESGATSVLKGISFAISSGESVGVVGSSGAGKTTLVDLLLGLLTPQSGQVIVDGLPIDPTKSSWQSDVGYVPQDIFLIDDTIRNNIAFGVMKNEISETQIVRSLELAQLSDLVRGLPDGLDTVIGERGVRLSGGQRQRIGIARALYHQPSLLVLDEATSALDLETEREFIETLEAVHSRVTMIVVSHRMSTLKYCDRIVRLEGGTLTEVR